MKVIGLIAEKDGKLVFVPVEESIGIDLKQIIPESKGEPEETGIAEPISPEQEKKLAQQEFEEGLDRRLKK